jgi:uncharacterized protein
MWQRTKSGRRAGVASLARRAGRVHECTNGAAGQARPSENIPADPRAHFKRCCMLSGEFDCEAGTLFLLDPKGYTCAGYHKDVPMKTIKRSLAMSFLLCACAAFANDAPPSDASLQELSTLSRREEVYNSVKAQMDAMINSSVKEASDSQASTPERQAVLDRMHAKMVAACDEVFNAQAMQMIMVRVYQATYTQDEVDGLIAFYKTPAGQALIKKAPLLMQNTMDEMRAAMRPLTQRIAQIKREGEQELKSLPAIK